MWSAVAVHSATHSSRSPGWHSSTRHMASRVLKRTAVARCASGAIATMIVGSLPDVARSWAEADPALKPGYIAVYETPSGTSAAASSPCRGPHSALLELSFGRSLARRRLPEGVDLDLRRKRRRPRRRCRGGRRLPDVDRVRPTAPRTPAVVRRPSGVECEDLGARRKVRLENSGGR